jgi:hypothetical protein
MMPCEPMPLLVPTTERKAAEVRPKLKRDQRLFLHGQPKAAVLFGNRQAEEAKARISSMMPRRDRVGFLDLGLGRDQLSFTKRRMVSNKPVEDFRIADHRCPDPCGRPTRKISVAPERLARLSVRFKRKRN